MSLRRSRLRPAGGSAALRHHCNKKLEYHLLDTGHFALEEEGDTIARQMREFFGKHVAHEGGGGDWKQQAAG